MFQALDKKGNDYVAIKKTRIVNSNTTVQSESELLKNCSSKYIVRYFDVLQNGKELWVGTGLRCVRDRS